MKNTVPPEWTFWLVLGLGIVGIPLGISAFFISWRLFAVASAVEFFASGYAFPYNKIASAAFLVAGVVFLVELILFSNGL